ncbi:glutaredoxin-like protein [Chthonomonas calidirosea]|uniref:Glutaredoxin and related proteins n=1 Tax=Chthonomonas calidirosea (strain DSM 23976 / ICMP 18418 / T49) TaxID=1303518 RepID=S0EYW2_CHTCT|nr:glutaredoxin family protein [Chthonomonas calidirosea]CCW35250.1 Glutaredoxin and related proteins [Chthonomonas calidirosea T49]CEK19855.1 glutaredoxin-like protein [Chthonomonas calidirosea]CEK19857.1 glutaredoxin-like protein [Chthonomonas calidirosea]CEK20734.1 glutaredoxin-like protein [Chthonomonas calidirosea]
MIVVYSTAWCPDCLRARQVLKEAEVDFVEIDIERTPCAEEAMRAVNGNVGKVPTILIEAIPEERLVLVEPSDKELREVLAAYKRRREEGELGGRC